MTLFGKRRYTLVSVKKKNIPDGIFSKCPECQAAAYTKALKDNLNVCPSCGYHFSLTAYERLEVLLDAGSFEEYDADLLSEDPLRFKGPKTYIQKLEADQEKTGLKEAVISGKGKINGQDVHMAVTDSRFIMGSMGSVVGEKITRAIELGLEKKAPVLVFSSSGGARR